MNPKTSTRPPILKSRRNRKPSQAPLPKKTGYLSLVGVFCVGVFGFGMMQSTVPTLTKLKSKKDLTGEWEVHHHVADSDFRSYRGMNHLFKVYFIQDGNRLIGEGEKVQVNGAQLKSEERTTIHFEGKIRADSVVGVIKEEGKLRSPIGRFAWSVGAGNSEMLGTFESSAGNSFGNSVVNRSR